MNAFIDNTLYPLKVVVAWIMVQFHSLLTSVFGLDAGSGLAWALSIVGLVIVIRIALIPLFVRQIKASRGMQLLAPEMQAIQKKYKGKSDPASREAMSRETMELYRKHGTNPFSSCLPILAQSPIFFALFRVLYSLGPLAEGKYPKSSIGPLTQQLAEQANEATLFGAPISSFFLQEGASGTTKIVSVALIVLMSLTTFTTQRQLTQKNMPASALQGPMAQQQKMLLYILPLVFAVSGVNFPIGVLIYWSTTNLWSMGQQFYVIRRNPTPGSEAERLLKERRARKAAAKGIVLEETTPAVEEKPRGQRVQPKRKDRARPPGTPGSADAAPKAAAEDTGTRPTTSGATDPARAPKRPTADGAKKPASGSGKRPTSGGTKRPAGASGTGATSRTGSATPGSPKATSPEASSPTDAGTAAPAPGKRPGGSAAGRKTSGSGPDGTSGTSTGTTKPRKPRSPQP